MGCVIKCDHTHDLVEALWFTPKSTIQNFLMETWENNITIGPLYIKKEKHSLNFENY